MSDLNETLVALMMTSTEEPSEEEKLSPWEVNFQNSSRFWVQRVLVPIVVLFGILGNLITIYILTRRPMRSSTNVYLCALAVSDLLFLVCTFTMSLKHYPEWTATSWLYWAFRRFGLWLTDASSSTSVWLTVSFTVERYIAVCHPMRGKIICTEERAIKVAIVVFTLCFIATSPTPFEWMIVNETSIENNNETHYELDLTEFGRDSTYVKIYYWFTSLTFVLVPIILLAIFNTFLILAVRNSRITRKAMTNIENSSSRHLQAIRQENRITITLIVVVIVFLVCQLPTATFLIYTIFHPAMTSREVAFHRGIGGIFNLLMTVNAAINFLLYTALSDKYRKYFCEFFIFWRRRRRGRGGLRGLYYDNPYEMDTMNTTVSSLSRGTSLRATINREVSPRSTPSPYGLRRTQTTGSGTNRSCRPVLMSSVKSVGSNSTYIKNSNVPLIQVDQI